MKSPIDRLSPEEKAILANFHDSEEFKVLRKLVDMERLDLAKDHVNQMDILQVRFLSGKTESLKNLILTIQKIKKDLRKADGSS